MDGIFDFFLDNLKNIEAIAKEAFVKWEDVESVAMSVINFVENISFALLNKWFPA